MAHFSGEPQMTRRAMPVGTEGTRETLPERAEVLGRRSVANLACRFRPGSWRHLRVAWGSRRDGAGLRGPGQRGIALLEVIITALIVGITVLGVSLMLVRGSAFTASQATNQAELYLAEQKLERLRILGFTGTSALGPSDAGATAGCGDDTEPCYNETLQGGAVTGANLQRFTRVTCVDYVTDSGPPYPSACPGPAPGAPPAWCPDPVSCTKRARVTVQPLDQATVAGAAPITLEIILVNPPQAVL